MKFSKLNCILIIFIEIFLMSIVGSASGYQFFLSCPGSVQVGTPLKCSIDSNFPAGTTFDVVMYPPGYTTTPLHSQTFTIQDNHTTQYQIFDTTGLFSGQYRVEIQFIGTDEARLSSDSVTLQLPRLLESLVANFSGIPRTGVAPLTVQFSDTSTGSPTGWAWYFGDEDYSAPWTQVNASPGWSARERPTSVAMRDGSILLIGGDGVGGGKNDVWRSMDYGSTWNQVNPSAEWAGRWCHTSVAMPDGSIVLMGGVDNSGDQRNDSWRSTDYGATWTQVNASSGEAGRYCHTSVSMLDGSIVVMGGFGGGAFLNNNVWRSTDNGATWKQMNASAGWTGRWGHTSVLTPDGSIVLMGGDDTNGMYRNDVWRSTDNGATWKQMNASAGWTGRTYPSSAAMPDGSIVLIGGVNDGGGKNDTWRSTDNGATWTQVNTSAGWTGRWCHTSIATLDGSIVFMGGNNNDELWTNDVWRLSSVGSSAQNPSHTYTSPGIYKVTLQSYNTWGYNSTRKTGYITVTAPIVSKIGVYRNGGWLLDSNDNFVWDGMPADAVYSFEGMGNTSVYGDWDGDGITELGVYDNGTWYLDYNANGIYDGPTIDRTAIFGPAGFNPIIGDWDGTGKDKIGMEKDGFWAIDYNGNYLWDGAVTDRFAGFGQAGDIPVVGDWDGNGKVKIGSFKDGFWAIDYDGNYLWDGAVTDRFTGFGQPGDIPIVGDWDGNGQAKIGVEKDGFWNIDYNGNYQWEGAVMDRFAGFGSTGDTPVIGDWEGNGKDKIGSFKDGFWAIDYNGNYLWDGAVIDRFAGFGQTGDIPVVGKWNGLTTDSQCISSISPTFTYGNDVPMTIIGTDFKQGINAKMTKSTGTSLTIEARSVRWDSATQVTAYFTIPTLQRGTYNVVVTNPDGTSCSLPNGFEAR